MILGAHESAAGGLAQAFTRAVSDGCRSLQVFTRNANQWNARALTAGDVAAFRAAQERTGLGPVLVHNSYLINLASPKEAVHRKSMMAMREEVDRCDQLGIPFLVMHPGAHLGSGADAGLRRIAESLDRLFEEGGRASRVQVLLEGTAGQGTVLGSRFEEVAQILHRCRFPDRLGVCVDTCHVFAAGYDLSSAHGYEATWRAFERTVGFRPLRAFHLNDSKKPLGGHVDRHEEIGQGCIGLEAFRRLVNDPRFRDLPAVLETPPGADGEPSFARNLRTLRSLEGS